MSRADCERMAGARREYQATISGHRWGLLWDEFTATGWRAVRVDRRTGERVEKGHSRAVWVMRFTGFDGDPAPRLAARCRTVKVKSREAR